MALIIKDRIKEVTTTTGTGDIVLGGSSATYDSFGSCMSNGDTTYYAIVHTVGGTDEWEVGLGTYNSTTDAIARTTISASSNAGSAVNFSAGPKNIFITNPADKAVYLNADGDIDLAGTIDGRDLSVDGAKLDGIESGATADQTDAEIKTAYENNSDTNAFTDAEKTKLSGIESSATADQTGAEIKTALFAESDTNNLTDTLLSKLNGIESGATADQTKADIDALGINADLLDGQHGSYYTGYTDTAIANLVDSSPATLDTLNELAAALGDDPNFATTVTNSIATKLPLAGGTMTGDITFNSTQLFDGRDVSADGATLDTLDTEAWRKGTDIPTGANLNDYTSDGYYHQNSNNNAAAGSNYPVDYAGMLEVTSDGNMVYQRYTVYNSTHDVYVRTYYNGTWYSWSKQWSDANDGSGSGLDADKLDGNHASAFAAASHTHAFNDLTGKTSGIGDYSTTGDLVSGRGSGGVALTINDGYGNANVTFNHQDGTPEQNGNAGRIEVNTDGTVDASMTIELKSNVTGGSAVSLVTAAAFSDTDQILTYAGTNRLQTSSSGVSIFGNLDVGQNDITAGDLYLADAEPRVQMNDTDGTNQYTTFIQSAGTTYYTATNNTNYGAHNFRAYNGTSTLTRMYIASNGDVGFYDDEGTQKMLWDASLERLRFNGDNLRLYHDGSNGYVSNVSTGSLVLRNERNDGDVYIQSDNGSGGTTNYFVADGSSGEAVLYHYGTWKIATKSYGAVINGNLAVTTVDASTSVQIGSEVVLQESTDRADLLQITSTTSTWGGIQVRNSAGEGRWSFMTDGGTSGFYDDENNEWAVQMLENSEVKLYYNGAEKLNTRSDGVEVQGRVFAEGGTSETSYDLLSGSYLSRLFYRDSDKNFGHYNTVGARTNFRIVSNATASSERMYLLESGGRVGINTTSPEQPLHVNGSIKANSWYRSTGNNGWYSDTYGGGINMTDTTYVRVYNSKAFRIDSTSNNSIWTKGGIRVDGSGGTRYISAGPNSTTDGSLYNNNSSTAYGAAMLSAGRIDVARWQNNCLTLNRMGNDGPIISFYAQGVLEGSMGVNGSTVSLSGGHLARWSRLADETKDVSIVKGTVMTNLDEMVVWHHEAQPATYYEEGDDLPMITDATFYEEGDELPEGMSVGDIKTEAVYAQVGDEKKPAKEAYTEDNEQLNKMAVSSVEGDPNVAGVFVNWDEDDEFNDMNIAMTGDMVIRIAQGTTVARGDLLMSAGDGTAKPQGDDIVRSKTIAKVTSTHVSHTYEDGSYLVPCVLMAC